MPNDIYLRAARRSLEATRRSLEADRRRILEDWDLVGEDFERARQHMANSRLILRGDLSPQLVPPAPPPAVEPTKSLWERLEELEGEPVTEPSTPSCAAPRATRRVMTRPEPLRRWRLVLYVVLGVITTGLGAWVLLRGIP